VQPTSAFPLAAALSALVLGTIGLGGGIYETLLVDRVWPDNPAVIQPSRGGINRKWFWGPIQPLYELALLLTAWMVWSDTHARPWIIIALSAHFAARAWSFAYFIPRALQFEKSGDLTEEQARLARQWTGLSRYRVVLETIAIVSQCAAIFQSGMR
jgi:hypothetical protein